MSSAIERIKSRKPTDRSLRNHLEELQAKLKANGRLDPFDIHELVKVRDWLLAEAFPATTLPMGANENGEFTIEGQNINMSDVTAVS